MSRRFMRLPRAEVWILAASLALASCAAVERSPSDANPSDATRPTATTSSFATSAPGTAALPANRVASSSALPTAPAEKAATTEPGETAERMGTAGPPDATDANARPAGTADVATSTPNGDAASGAPRSTSPKAAGASAIGPSGCPDGDPARHTYSEGQDRFPTVRVGWKRAQVLQKLGPPTTCERSEWTYVAGPYSGPQVTYTFQFRADRVAHITESTVGCRVY